MTVLQIKKDATDLLRTWESLSSSLNCRIPQSALDSLRSQDFSGFTYAMLDVIPSDISNHEAATICYALKLSLRP